MRIYAPPYVESPEALAKHKTSSLLLAIASHASVCLNSCPHCSSWFEEIDRRLPPRTVETVTVPPRTIEVFACKMCGSLVVAGACTLDVSHAPF